MSALSPRPAPSMKNLPIQISSLAVVALAALGAVPQQASAAEPAPLSWVVTPSGQLRDRLFLDSGRDFSDFSGPAHRRYVTQRARMSLQAQYATGMTVKVTAQDVRIWGEEPDPTAYVGKGVDFYEAYVGIPLGHEATLTLGRQGLSWDNERLIGKLDWAQRGRAFDALRLDHKHGALDIQAFAAHLGNDSAQQDADGHVTNLPGSEKVLAGAHLGWSVSPKLKAAAVYVYRSAEAIGEDRHTAGLFATGQAGPLTLTGEGYAQLGDLAHNSISAWMAAGRVTYKSTLPGALGVGLFGEALSGDRTKEGAFDTLYGTNHKFYGEMDFFLDIPKHTALHGLVDAGASLSALPSPWLTCNLDWHLMRTYRAHVTPSSTSSELGQEIDVKATAAIHKNLSVQALFGVFLPGEALKGIRGLKTDAATEQMLFVTVDATF